MKRPAIAVGISSVVIAGVALGLHAQSLNPGTPFSASADADAALRTAARALASGVTDGSADWDGFTHRLSSSSLTISSRSLTAATFDTWTGSFCVSATNGHRVTNTSRGIEIGSCPSPSPTQSTPTETATATTGGAPPGWVRLCKNADLQLGFGLDVPLMTGEHAVIYSLTNRAATQCSLVGFPDVTFRDRAGNVLPLQYTHASSSFLPPLRPDRFKLRPGERAFFLAAQYRCEQGPAMTAATITMRLPTSHETRAARPSLVASRANKPELAYCNGGSDDPGNVMAVSPLTPDVASLLGGKD